MLATRIIPTMLVSGSKLVKGKQFNSWRSIGHAAQAAQIHAARGVDELCILDITATKEGRGPDFELCRTLSQWCFTPLTFGGGVRSINDISGLLWAGADKVCIGTMLGDSELIEESCAHFGSQAIVASIDYRACRVVNGHGEIKLGHDDGPCPMHPLAWASHLEDLGVGEILLTCIDREGMMDGYDLEMIRLVSREVSIPVIAHGGCGMPWHCLEAIRAGADAVAVGSMFCFTDETPRSVAEYLDREGIEVRLTCV